MKKFLENFLGILEKIFGHKGFEAWHEEASEFRSQAIPRQEKP